MTGHDPVPAAGAAGGEPDDDGLGMSVERAIECLACQLDGLTVLLNVLFAKLVETEALTREELLADLRRHAAAATEDAQRRTLEWMIAGLVKGYLPAPRRRPALRLVGSEDQVAGDPPPLGDTTPARP